MGGIMGGLYRIAEWIMRLSVTNVLWAICSSPFILLMSGLLFAETTDDVYSIFIVLGIVAPFTLFPATAAMWNVARKWVIGPEDAPLFRTFFSGYKTNYKQSMFGGILYSIIILLLTINYRFYVSFENSFQFLALLFVVFVVVIIISAFHFLSILVHLQMSTFQILKNAVLISMGRPLTSLMLALSNGFILYLSFFRFTFLIPFFMGSVIAMISFWHFNRVFTKVQQLQEERKEEEDEAEESEGTLDTIEEENR